MKRDNGKVKVLKWIGKLGEWTSEKGQWESESVRMESENEQCAMFSALFS